MPKDYPELNRNEIDVFLVEGGPTLLAGMSEQASNKAQQFLEELGVKIKLNALVTDFDGEWVHMNDGSSIRANKVIWAAGVRGSKMGGLTPEMMGPGNRIKVNRHNQIEAFENVYAIGDIAFMTEEKYPKGHPQVAQVALQQAGTLAKNLRHLMNGEKLEVFRYKDKGSMATIGRNLAVVDLPHIRFQGAFAWFVWMFVHLFTLLGVKNKVFVFINWVWNYFTYDQSLRLIIKPRVVREDTVHEVIVHQA
jgi:NADH dehydrogenase